MRSIFKAMDGGHLDRALFRSNDSGNEKPRQDEIEPKKVSGRERFGRRMTRRADGRTDSRQSSHSDLGL